MKAQDQPINHMNSAYLDSEIERSENSETWVRTFSKDIDTKLLDWHVDGQRTIEVIESDGEWGVQFEGDEPIILHTGDVIESPSDVLHRPIKGEPKTDLVLKITEYK